MLIITHYNNSPLHFLLHPSLVGLFLQLSLCVWLAPISSMNLLIMNNCHFSLPVYKVRLLLTLNFCFQTCLILLCVCFFCLFGDEKLFYLRTLRKAWAIYYIALCPPVIVSTMWLEDTLGRPWFTSVIIPLSIALKINAVRWRKVKSEMRENVSHRVSRASEDRCIMVYILLHAWFFCIVLTVTMFTFIIEIMLPSSEIISQSKIPSFKIYQN